MDAAVYAARVREARFEMKQSRVDMTARPPRDHQYDAEARRVQRNIMQAHPLSAQERIAADKLTGSGMDPYESYWGIRNSRYNAQGRRRRSRPSAAVMSFQANPRMWDK